MNENDVRFGYFPGEKTKVLTFSYDDGRVEDRRLIDILNANGLKGTFNLNSNRADGNSSHIPTCEWQTVYAGHEIAVHGRNHTFLEMQPKEAVAYEILEDRRALEAVTGGVVTGMAYPYGTLNDALVNCLDALGIAYSRTTQSTNGFNLPDNFLRWNPTCHHNAPDLMQKLENFKKAKVMACFYVWGHSFEFPRNDNWNVIEDFCREAGKMTDTWFATNGEIYTYMQALHRVVLNVDRTVAYNPSGMEVILSVNGKPVHVPAGATVPLV